MFWVRTTGPTGTKLFIKGHQQHVTRVEDFIQSNQNFLFSGSLSEQEVSLFSSSDQFLENHLLMKQDQAAISCLHLVSMTTKEFVGSPSAASGGIQRLDDITQSSVT